MRCPRCGLIHADAVQYCRRCDIDLSTGVARPREASPTPAASPPPWVQLLEAARPWLIKLRPRRRRKAPAEFAASRPQPAAAPIAAVVPSRPKEPLPAPGPSRLALARKRIRSQFQGLNRRLRASRGSLKTLTCIQCSSVMRIERLPVYGAGGPFALIAAGVVVFALGFRAWPLLLLGPLGVGLGIFYRRRGPTHWRCRSCGYLIPREG